MSLPDPTTTVAATTEMSDSLKHFYSAMLLTLVVFQHLPLQPANATLIRRLPLELLDRILELSFKHKRPKAPGRIVFRNARATTHKSELAFWNICRVLAARVSKHFWRNVVVHNYQDVVFVTECLRDTGGAAGRIGQSIQYIYTAYRWAKYPRNLLEIAVQCPNLIRLDAPLHDLMRPVSSGNAGQPPVSENGQPGEKAAEDSEVELLLQDDAQSGNAENSGQPGDKMDVDLLQPMAPENAEEAVGDEPKEAIVSEASTTGPPSTSSPNPGPVIPPSFERLKSLTIFNDRNRKTRSFRASDLVGLRALKHLVVDGRLEFDGDLPAPTFSLVSLSYQGKMKERIIRWVLSNTTQLKILMIRVASLEFFEECLKTHGPGLLSLRLLIQGKWTGEFKDKDKDKKKKNNQKEIDPIKVIGDHCHGLIELIMDACPDPKVFKTLPSTLRHIALKPGRRTRLFDKGVFEEFVAERSPTLTHLTLFGMHARNLWHKAHIPTKSKHNRVRHQSRVFKSWGERKGVWEDVKMLCVRSPSRPETDWHFVSFSVWVPLNNQSSFHPRRTTSSATIALPFSPRTSASLAIASKP